MQREGRVAWMQLSNASVESYADNVLTLAFANAGMAKGFLNGGYDKHLSKVLEALETSANCLLARMSGSGATCFGLYPDRNSARSAASCVTARG